MAKNGNKNHLGNTQEKNSSKFYIFGKFRYWKTLAEWNDFWFKMHFAIYTYIDVFISGYILLRKASLRKFNFKMRYRIIHQSPRTPAARPNVRKIILRCIFRIQCFYFPVFTRIFILYIYLSNSGTKKTLLRKFSFRSLRVF